MYNVINLLYPYYALEPIIDEKTVNIHYNKHHKKYMENLNKLTNSSIPLNQIPKRIDEFPINKRGEILYNAGGVLNHNLYFQSLNPNPSLPKGKLLTKINETFGNFENFKTNFITKAKLLKGSGYTFLVSDNKGNLQIINMPNQETPLSYNLTPLFNIDLWEHAYYLKYQNNKDKYLQNIWSKTSFDNASKIYELLI